MNNKLCQFDYKLILIFVIVFIIFTVYNLIIKHKNVNVITLKLKPNIYNPNYYIDIKKRIIFLLNKSNIIDNKKYDQNNIILSYNNLFGLNESQKTNLCNTNNIF